MDEQAKEWRNKYEQAVVSFKEKSAEYNNVIQQLRLNLSKISVAGNGVDAQLDRQLAALRREIRVGAEHISIQAHVDGIANSLRRFDDVKAQQQSFFAKVINNLIQPLSQIQLPKDIDRQFKILQNKLANEVASEPTAIVNEFSQIFHELIQYINKPNGISGLQSSSVAPQTSSTDSKKGLWNRLTKKDPGTLSLDKQISTCLEDMLSHLRLPKELSADMEQVKSLLHDNLTIKELEVIIESITALVVKAFNLEQDKLRNFLEQMTGRLGDMQSFLQEAHDETSSAMQDSANLDKSVQSDIASIQDGMKSNLAVEDLSQLLSERLDSISHNISDYHKKESVRLEKSMNRINQLETKLKDSENETTQLKESLSAQRHRAQHDPLTGLPNRESYNEYVSQAINRWQRGYGELCIAVADIDFFKKINDNYGHLAGDKVLKKIASIIRSNLRAVDFVGRYGGEEFVIILEKTGIEDAIKVLDKLRLAIVETKFHFREARVDITCSFGVTKFNSGEDCDQAFSRADEALYAAKAGGRNQVQSK